MRVKIEDQEIIGAAREVSTARVMFYEGGKLLERSQRAFWELLTKKFSEKRLGAYYHEEQEVEILEE